MTTLKMDTFKSSMEYACTQHSLVIPTEVQQMLSLQLYSHALKCVYVFRSALQVSFYTNINIYLNSKNTLILKFFLGEKLKSVCSRFII